MKKRPMKQLLYRTGWLLSAAFSATAVAAPAGTLDFSFGEGFGHQTVGFNLGGGWSDTSQAMVKGPGGTVYLIGHVELDNGEHGIGLARLLHDGQKDESFGPNGKQFYKEPSFERVIVRDAAMQADGKIVVVGSRETLQNDFTDMMACRFESSGAIDVSFGNPLTPGCRAIPSPVGVRAEASSVLIQPDGRIVVAGYARDADLGIDRAAAVRLLSSGVPDSSFGNQGILAPGYKVPLPFLNTTHTRFHDVARTSNGKLVFVGDEDTGADDADTDVLVVQLNEEDGATDSGFGAGTGTALLFFDEGGDANDSGTAVLVLSDGAIVVTGSVQTAPQQVVPFVAKLDSSGEPFPGFVNGGQLFFNTCNTEPCEMRPMDLQVSDSGQLLLAGTVETEDLSNFFVMRLEENGERDSDFGPDNGLNDGIAYISIDGTFDAAYRVLPQGERVLVAGATDISDDADFAIARLDHGIEETFTVSPEPGPGGSMSPEDDQPVNHSDQVDFIVTPQEGFSILQVEGCGVTEFEGVYTTAPITADCAVVATFAQKPEPGSPIFSDGFED